MKLMKFSLCLTTALALTAPGSPFPRTWVVPCQTAEQDLLSKLIAARPQDERTALIESNKDHLTIDVARGLSTKGTSLGRNGLYREALDFFRLAADVSTRLSD